MHHFQSGNCAVLNSANRFVSRRSNSFRVDQDLDHDGNVHQASNVEEANAN